EQTHSRAEYCEQHTFGQKLARETRAACAECQAQRNFLLPDGSAREQEISDIGTRNEKDEPVSAQQNEKCRSDVANNLFMERDGHRASSGVVNRVLLRESSGDCFHLGPGLFQRDARFQARDDFEEMISPLRCFLLWKCDRHPELIAS